MNPGVVRDRKNYVQKCQNETQTGLSQYSQYPDPDTGQPAGAHAGHRMLLKTGDQSPTEKTFR